MVLIYIIVNADAWRIQIESLNSFLITVGFHQRIRVAFLCINEIHMPDNGRISLYGQTESKSAAYTQ
jgi:hypothetical protein